MVRVACDASVCWDFQFRSRRLRGLSFLFRVNLETTLDSTSLSLSSIPWYCSRSHHKIMSGRQQRVMVQPIVSLCHHSFPLQLIFSTYVTCQNVIFKNLQQVRYSLKRLRSDPQDWVLYTSQKQKVVIWLYDNIEMRIEGRIIVRVPHVPSEHDWR